MGHSAPRPTTGGRDEGLAKMQKRLELLPEEAIYLIERGSLFCWKQTDLELGQVPGLNDVGGSPMTVQQAFSEMLGKGDLTMEKFQVCFQMFFFYSVKFLMELGLCISQTARLHGDKV